MTIVEEILRLGLEMPRMPRTRAQDRRWMNIKYESKKIGAWRLGGEDGITDRMRFETGMGTGMYRNEGYL
jgi:hypothetical protein